MTPRRAWSDRLRGRLGRDHDQREVTKSDDAWREQLSPEQYRILRRPGTEAAFTGHDPAVDAGGAYRCAGCDSAVFPADAKFDSGTGWPSFSRSAPDGVELHRDFTLGIPRTEVLCRRCGGHLGHVFNDGPTPERKRYCINAGALAPGERSGHPTTEEAVWPPSGWRTVAMITGSNSDIGQSTPSERTAKPDEIAPWPSS